MPRVVIFTKNNARCLYADDVTLFKLMKNAVIDPDLAEVRGTPPHFWKLEGGKIKRMTPAEMAFRESQHEAEGVDNHIDTSNVLPFKRKPKLMTNLVWAIIIAWSAAMIGCTYLLLKK